MPSQFINFVVGHISDHLHGKSFYTLQLCQLTPLLPQFHHHLLYQIVSIFLMFQKPICKPVKLILQDKYRIFKGLLVHHYYCLFINKTDYAALLLHQKIKKLKNNHKSLIFSNKKCQKKFSWHLILLKSTYFFSSAEGPYKPGTGISNNLR